MSRPILILMLCVSGFVGRAPAATCAQEAPDSPPPEEPVGVEDEKPSSETDAPSSDDSPKLPAENEEPTFDWSGEVRLGWREVRVNGSEDQFDADLNLDRGFRILGTELEAFARRKDAPFDHLRARSSGIDDPFALAEIEIERFDLWTTRARWQKSDNLFGSVGEFHPYHSKRHLLDIGGGWTPNDAWSFDLDYRHQQRAGSSRPTRQVVGSAFIGGVAPFHERSHDIDLAIGFVPSEHTSFHLTGGWGTESRDDVRYFSGDLSPGAPLQPIERFDAEEHNQTTRLGGRGKLSPIPDELWIEGGIQYAYIRRDIDAEAQRLDFGSDASDQLFEDVSLEGSRVDADVELGLRPVEPLTWLTSYRRRVAVEDDDLRSVQISRDPPFSGAIMPSGFVAFNGVTTRLNAIASELDWQMLDELAVRAGYQYGEDHIKSGLAGIDQKVYHHGPSTGLTWRPNRRWRFDGDYRALDTTQPLTEASSADTDRFRARAEWLALDELSLSVSFDRTDRRQNTSALDTRSEAFNGTVSWTADEDTQVSAGVTWRQIRSRTRALYATPPPAAPFVVGYDGEEVVTHLDIVYDRLDPVSLTLDFTHVRLAGDFPYDLLDIAGGPSYALDASWRLGLEYRYRRYNERSATANDYDAEIWLATLVWTF